MSQLSPSSPLNLILELKDEAEKQKVELTPEIKAYIQFHLGLVQEKMSKGEGVTEDDMKFIEEVRSKVGFIIEARKRHINLQQWMDLIHLAQAAKKSKEWIDEEFRFPGGNQIKIETLWLVDCDNLIRIPDGLELKRNVKLDNCKSLIGLPESLKVPGFMTLRGCISLTHLPKNLEVGERLSLDNCASLKYLPENLRVGDSLSLAGCRSLTVIPDSLQVQGYLNFSGCSSLKHLPENLIAKDSLLLQDCTALESLPKALKVGKVLALNDCVSLVSLPEDMKVGEFLSLRDCSTLSKLPENIEVGGDIYLSHNLQSQVKEDAERLKKEGKIKGKIIYID